MNLAKQIARNQLTTIGMEENAVDVSFVPFHLAKKIPGGNVP
jgi:hypothetical protein